MQTKDCTTCGAVGCDHKDVSNCGTEKYLWEPIPLHPDTEALVQRFAEAMRNKLAKAERKYGYSNLWKNDDWLDECRAKLIDHLHKGDPLDVANYCAFLWHHGSHCKPNEHRMESSNGKVCGKEPLGLGTTSDGPEISMQLLPGYEVVADDVRPSSDLGAWTCKACGFRGFWRGGPHCVQRNEPPNA